MALDFQLQQYPFRTGLAEGTDPRQVPPGTLVTAENCVWKQAGRLEKRFGISAVASVGASTIARLFTRGTELCATDGASLYSYSPALTSWSNRDLVPNVGLTWTTLLDTGSGIALIDQAVVGNVRMTAWITGDPRGVPAGNLCYQFHDTVTGANLTPPGLLGGAGCVGVRVVVLGGVAHLISRAGAHIGFTAIDMTTFAILAAPTVRLDAAQTGFDVKVIGSTIVLAYENTVNALKLYSYTYAAGVYTQVATGGITGEAGSGFQNIGIDGAVGEVLYVVYSRANVDTRVRIATADASTLVQATAPVDLEVDAVGDAGTYTGYRNVSVIRTSASTAIACWTTLGSTTQTPRAATMPVSSTLTLSTTAKRGTWGAEFLTRPFILASKVYALALSIVAGGGPAAIYTPLTTTYLMELETSATNALSSWTPHRYVGQVDVIVGGAYAPNFVANAISVSSTEVSFALPFQSIASPASGGWRCGARQVSATIGASLPVDMWRSVTVGREAYVSGPILSAYDGRICFDYGATRCSAVSGLAGGGGSMVAGDYLYATVPEYHSSAGMLHRGPTFTTPTAITVGGAGSVSLTITSITAETKQDVANSGLVTGYNILPEQIALYRTTVGGSTLQRLTVDPVDSVVVDSALAYAQTFVDTKADANISPSLTTGGGLASRPALYTTGGILDDYQPPASVTMFHHADRLWVLAGDRRTWWYSKAFQDDLGTAPGFNPAFLITFDDVQTAGATMDDKAIFFSATGVRYMLGTGPAPNGQNSDFSAPVVIQSDVGCTSARSVVGTPDGVMFLSDRGLYLLTRGLELVWIGRPVKDTLAAYPTVTSAVLVAKQNQVRFTCNNAGGTAGVVLVYDYVEKQWTTAKYHDGTTYGCPIADACMWNGAWTFATPAGLVFTESTSSYLDGSHYVPMTLETAWISASGPLAFQSVRELALHGQSYTDHDLTVSVGFDSDTSYPQVATFLATTPVTAVGIEECTVSIGTRRKCETIRFKIADSTPTAPGVVGTGRGPAFDMMGLEVGMKRGFAGNPATKRA